MGCGVGRETVDVDVVTKRRTSDKDEHMEAHDKLVLTLTKH